MSGIWFQLALVAALVLLNAVFAGSEMALVSLREGQLQRLEHESSRGKVLGRLARDPNRFLATIQVGITLAGFLASASAAVSLAEPLEEPLSFLGGAARPGSIFVVTIALSYLTLVLGELAPKRLAMQRSEGWALLVARPLSGLSRIARPAIWLLSVSTDLVVRVLGGDPNQEREAVTEAELRDMVRTQESFTLQQRTIISGAFEIADRRLSEVMRPRPDVVTLDAETSCPEALAELAASGHSRAPVCVNGTLDETVGVVHLRDLLLDEPGCVARDVANPAVVLPESAGVLDALRTMQTERTQLALVVSEHGGAEGIVTVEDLIEEVVGEIHDETDHDLEALHQEADGSLVLTGRFPAHELPEVGISIPEGDYATIAGFLLSELGRVPKEPGDVVEHGRWRFEIIEVDERAIASVRATQLEEPDEPDDDDGE
ncbi:MAG: hemolysin family protein [Actinomycetota bacterium]